MSGTPYCLDYYVITGSSSPDRNQELFNRISEFFSTNPNFIQIAQSGSGEEAFKVWRAVSASIPFDVICKWSWSSYWTFWSINNSYGVGILAAAHPSGEAWAGTTNNFNDTKPNSPFKTGSIVYNRCNAAGGVRYTTKNEFNVLFNASIPVNLGVICTGDADSFCFTFDQFNDHNTNGVHYFGAYTPATASYNLPYVMLNAHSNDWFRRDINYGSTTAQVQQGCISYAFVTGSVTESLPNPERVAFDYSTIYTLPIPISSSLFPKVLEFPMLLSALETGAGYVGSTESVRITWGPMPHQSRLYDNKRITMTGSAGSGYPSFTIPWATSSITSGSYFTSDECLFLTGTSDQSRLGLSGIRTLNLGKTGENITVITVVSQSSTIYRCLVAGVYVYFSGTIPPGASDIVTVL
jgi:hypothetical protein